MACNKLLKLGTPICPVFSWTLGVDDIIVTDTHLHLTCELISRLQQEFPVKDLRPLSYFLGIQVTRTPTGLHSCQSKYVTNLLLLTHMAEAKPASSPCALSSKLLI
jgi:hypothetical protein